MWIGRSPVRVSSMFTESMPTSAAPASTSAPAAARQERVAGVAVVVGAPVHDPSPCGTSTARPATSRPSSSRRGFARRRGVDEDAGHGGHPGQVEAGEVVAVGEAVERRVEVGAGVGDHVDAADLELEPGA